MSAPERVLVALDGSDQSRAGLEYAAETYTDATIVCFHAIDPFDSDPEEATAEPLTEAWLEQEHERVEALFDRALERVDLPEDRIDRETNVGQPAESIVAYTEEEPIDHVVVGSVGRGGANRLRLGSVAEVVVRRSPIPVTVVR